MTDDSTRRVPGLRREEVAALAGISPEYYLRLEQGKDRHPSSQVVKSLAAALQLDDVGLEYLERLSRHTRPASRSDAGDTAQQLGGLLQLIGQWGTVPAFVTDSNLDVVLSNPLADRLGDGGLSRGANGALVMFSQQYQRIVPEWPLRAAEVVAALRFRGDPADPRFQEILGLLSIRSPLFREMWRRQEVHRFTRGDLVVPVDPFGVVRFRWQSLVVAGAERFTITSLYADPGSQAAAVLAYAAARPASSEASPTNEVVDLLEPAD